MRRRFAQRVSFMTSFVAVIAAATASADPWAIVALPDTQLYSATPTNFPNFEAQTQWIVDNLVRPCREDGALVCETVFVTHEGDVVQNGSSTTQWDRADQAMSTLDGVSDLPYSVAAGNHDYAVVGKRGPAFEFASYFGRSRYVGRSWYGCASYNDLNHFQFFQGGGYTFLHLALEWEVEGSISDPNTALGWAQSVIDLYPGLPTIITTHSHVWDKPGSEGRTLVPQTCDGNPGETVFQQLVRTNDQVFMVLNGHWHQATGVDEGEYNLTSTNDSGNEVFEMLANFQDYPNGGDGWLRILEFVPGAGAGGTDRVHVSTYSPTLDAYQTEARSEFDLDFSFAARFGAPKVAPPVTCPVPSPLPVLIAKCSTWRYFDDGLWSDPDFDDSGWASGPAELGYNDGDEATVVGFGGDPADKHITTYFRHEFNVANPGSVSTLSLDVLRDDGAIAYLNGVEVFRTNMPAGVVDFSTLASTGVTGVAETTFHTTAVDPLLLVAGTNVLAVEVHQFMPNSSDLSFDLSLTANGSTLLVSTGAVWTYFDEGLWSDPDFDDSTWAQGPAELGYNDGDEATVVSFGGDPGDKHITTYFRHAFDVPTGTAFKSIELELLRDDGALVYLNGEEIFRDNMPLGTIDAETLASTGVGGAGETTFYPASADPLLLVPGENVVAVEIHQADPASSDLSFEVKFLPEPAAPIRAAVLLLSALLLSRSRRTHLRSRSGVAPLCPRRC